MNSRTGSQTGFIVRRTPNRTTPRPSSNLKTTTATTTSSLRRVVGGKFDFDAPQFEDFTQEHYTKQRAMLEEAINLPIEERHDWIVQDIEQNCEAPKGSWEDGKQFDEWFQQVHREHEPSSPMTPAGPLITPESSSNNFNVKSSSPFLNSPVSRPSSYMSCSSPLAGRQPTTSRSGPSPLGLRSKPLRVLQNNGGGGSITETSRSSRGSSLQFFYPEMAQVKTPSKKVSPAALRWRQTSAFDGDFNNNSFGSDVPRRSSSIEGAHGSFNNFVGDNDGMGSGTSLPSFSLDGHASNIGWSSIPETPPILASGILLEEHPSLAHLRKRSLPRSPLVMQEVVNTDVNIEPPRKLGLASRAMRVVTSEVKDSLPSIMPVKVKAKSPLVKRLKVDARFCPAPAPIKSRTASPPEKTAPPTNTFSNSIDNGVRRERHKPVKLDDLKKLLAEHNQKLRPHQMSNITRRR